MTRPEVMGALPVRLHRSWAVPSAVALACAVLFAGLVDGVRERGDLSAFDPTVREALVSARSATLTSVAHAVTLLGSTAVLLVLGAVVAGGLGWRRRSAAPLVTVALTLGGSGALTYVLKTVIGRHRPPVVDMLGAAEHDLSFPSGHTLNSAVFVALVLWLFKDDLAALPRGPRTAVVAVGVLLALSVGVSRAYLGYHWMTDVLAGWVVATGWLALLLAGRALVMSGRRA